MEEEANKVQSEKRRLTGTLDSYEAKTRLTELI
jgi:hypothetical protein